MEVEGYRTLQKILLQNETFYPYQVALLLVLENHRQNGKYVDLKYFNWTYSFLFALASPVYSHVEVVFRQAELTLAT